MSKNQGRQCDRFKKQRKIHKLWPVDHSSKARWEQWLTLRFSPQFTTSMVVQWIRICPLMQWTRVWSLVWEDSKCGETDKPMQHNYWARALETQRPNYWPCRLQLLTPMCPETQLLTLQAATPEACAPRACALWWEAITVRRPHAISPALHNWREKPVCSKETRYNQQTRNFFKKGFHLITKQSRHWSSPLFLPQNSCVKHQHQDRKASAMSALLPVAFARFDAVFHKDEFPSRSELLLELYLLS